jgi:hypothetical protein
MTDMEAVFGLPFRVQLINRFAPRSHCDAHHAPSSNR